MAKEKSEKQLTSYDLIKANLELAVYKVGAILPSQPLHVVMRHQQAALASDNPRSLSMIKAYREICSKRSLPSLLNPLSSPLYKGFLPGLLKEGGKNLMYKGALIKGAPNLAESILPESLRYSTSPTQYKLIKAVSAGVIASVSDATLGGVLENYATFRATSQGKYADASLYRELQLANGALSKMGVLYRGFIPTTIKGTAAFSTFFYLTHPIQKMTASLYGLSPKDASSVWYCMATSALFSGMSVAFTSSAFDIIKTQSQMPGSKEIGVFKALAHNFELHGLKGITAGLPAKIMMITVGWGLNFFATQGSLESKEDKPDDVPKHEY
jgi:hypothetical protein